MKLVKEYSAVLAMAVLVAASMLAWNWILAQFLPMWVVYTNAILGIVVGAPSFLYYSKLYLNEVSK